MTDATDDGKTKILPAYLVGSGLKPEGARLATEGELFSRLI